MCVCMYFSAWVLVDRQDEAPKLPVLMASVLSGAGLVPFQTRRAEELLWGYTDAVVQVCVDSIAQIMYRTVR